MTLSTPVSTVQPSLITQIFDGNPVPTFVIDREHRVTHWNRACQVITGKSAGEMIGTTDHRQIFYKLERATLADLIVDGANPAELAALYRDKRLTRSLFIEGAYEAEDYFPHFGDDGCWLFFTAAPLKDVNGRIVGAIETLQDVSDRRRAEAALVQHLHELDQTVQLRTNDLVQAQQHLVQSEKMASIGQLAAGVAHEINNPIGFVHSNMGSLEHYFSKLLGVLEHFETHRELIEGTGDAGKAWVAQVEALKAEADYEYLKEDIPTLLAESVEGIERVKRIVLDLKDFSRVDSGHLMEQTDLRKGLDSTLNIVMSEIKYRADVIREYAGLPVITCIPSQLNQVFMNLIVNAAHAIPESRRGAIAIRGGHTATEVWVSIADNGVGMSKDVQKRIFEPFFTTKPVGKGTGLGLSLSHGIVQKHGGRIDITSELGTGTTFTVWLPIDPIAATEPAVPPAPTF